MLKIVERYNDFVGLLGRGYGRVTKNLRSQESTKLTKFASRLKIYGPTFSSTITVVALIVFVVSPVWAATPGEISEWTTEENALPATRVEQGTATYNDYVYLVGGSGGVGVRTSTVYAHIEDDGSIGEWQESDYDLPQESYRLKAEAHNGYLYAIGGRNGPALNTIYRAELDPDTGEPGEWSAEANTLPAVRYYHSTFIFENYLYVVGGDNNGGAVNTVYSAPIVDGTIGAWTQADDDLPENISLSTVEVHGDYAYLMGGHNGSASDSVYYAVVVAGGGIGNWVLMDDALPQGVQGASSVVIGDEIFVIGGYNGTSRLNTVYSATISEPGETADGWSLAEATLPTAMDQGGAIMHEEETYTFGGLNTSGFQAAVYSTVGANVATIETIEATNVTETTAELNGEAQFGGGLTIEDFPEDLGLGFLVNTSATVDSENFTNAIWTNSVSGIEESDTNVSFSASAEDLECETQYWYRATYELDTGVEFDTIGFAENTETFTTDACNEDSDDDGVSNEIEDAGPNDGDANQDGTPDSEQAHVSSFVNSVTGEYSVLDVFEECSIERVVVVSEEGVSSSDDADHEYPAGLMDFSINCGEENAGLTATIVQIHYGVALEDFSLRKYTPARGYFEVEGAEISEEDFGESSAVVAEYRITDGEEYDIDDEVNGVIEDPAGLGSLVSEDDSSALANTGMNQTLVTAIALVLIGLGLSIARKYSANNIALD